MERPDAQPVKLGARATDENEQQHLPFVPIWLGYNPLHNGATDYMLHDEKDGLSVYMPVSLVSRFDRIDARPDTQGFEGLDRGQSVDMDDVLEKAHAIVNAVESRCAPPPRHQI